MAVTSSQVTVGDTPTALNTASEHGLTLHIENVKTIINPPGSAGSDDPLAQRGTIAWKVEGYAVAVIQDALIVRVEHGYTA